MKKAWKTICSQFGSQKTNKNNKYKIQARRFARDFSDVMKTFANEGK